MPTSPPNATSARSTLRSPASVWTAVSCCTLRRACSTTTSGKAGGLSSVWINRRHHRPGWGATPEPTGEWSYDLQFNSMADFASAVDEAFNRS